MKLDIFSSSSSYTDGDRENLKQLHEIFGSVLSLEDIASAYCETGRNLSSTAEILSSVQDSSSTSGSSLSEPEANVESLASSSSGHIPFVPEAAPIAKVKPRKCSAAIGTVSGLIGKDYIAPKSQSNGLKEKTKPVKLHSDDFPVSEIWDEKRDAASTSSGESMDNDVQEFIFKMLGNGFQLDKDVIQDVVGQCGYNMPMSIDRLLDLSAKILENSDDVIGRDVEVRPYAENVRPAAERLETDVNGQDKAILSQTKKDNRNMSREVLETLFTAPGRFDEKEAHPIRPVRQSRHWVVDKPLDDKLIEDFTFITRQRLNDQTDESSSYDDLRKAVKEYWNTMKEYYKAALEAFSRKDFETAQRLLEEGTFFKTKAQEADEKSAKKLTGDSEEVEELSVSMHYLGSKDAVRHMKLQLTSLAGLPSIPRLKVVVGTGSNSSKDTRRKRLICELLENEKIPWTEEENGWTISIRMNEIDPRKLSFANK